MPRPDASVDRVEATVCTVPLPEAESDGTLTWDAVTLVIAHAHGGGATGMGYTYADPAAATVVAERLSGLVTGRDAFAVPAAWDAMVAAVRNIGRPGITSSAIAAVDVALWDLKARLLDLPLVDLLGPARDEVAVYASGGFTSYSLDRLRRQAEDWAAAGHRRVKVKVGRDPRSDVERVRAVRDAVGDGVEVFVDANGALDRKQALAAAEAFAALGVTWLEEPVSSDDVDGLRLLRDRAPAGVEITAGEYGYDLFAFRRLLEAGAVDVLMPDATRCGGITGFLRAAALCDGFQVPLSAHTAPALHLHVCAAAPRLRHLEWFHDHALVERELFDGAVEPSDGALRPDRSRPGMGLELRPAAARRYREERACASR